MKGAIPFGLAALCALLGAYILLRPEFELGHVIGLLLLGLAFALATLGLARRVGHRARWMLAAGYAGAVVGAIVSRLWLGFHPMGVADAPVWLAVLILTGPVVVAQETPLLVALGAVAGVCSFLLVKQRKMPPAAN